MNKNIKIVSYVIMQTLILLTSFLIIFLSLKYKFTIKFPMLILLVTQLFLFVFVVNNFLNKHK